MTEATQSAILKDGISWSFAYAVLIIFIVMAVFNILLIQSRGVGKHL